MEQTARIEHAELPTPLYAAAIPESGGIAELVRVFWRRKMLLMGTMMLVTGLAAFTAFQITPQYTAATRMMVHPEKQAAGLGMLGGLGALGGQSLLQGARSQLYGEIEVLRSHRLIEKAVVQLGLTNDPEFNKALQSGVFSALSELGPFAWFLELFGPGDEPSVAAETPVESQELRHVVDLFATRLMVRPPGISNVIVVDPTKST